MTNVNMNIQTVKNYLENMNGEDLQQLVSELNSWNGSLSSLEVHQNDEEFFEIFFSNKPHEAVRAANYGNYDYSHDLVRFNGYGNLESMDEYEYHEQLKESADEIADVLIDNVDHVEIDDLLKMLIEFDEDNVQEITLAEFLEEHSDFKDEDEEIKTIQEWINHDDNDLLIANADNAQELLEEIDNAGEELDNINLFLVDGMLIAVYA